MATSLVLLLLIVPLLIDAKIPWTYEGYNVFPTLFFGASPHNLEPTSVMTMASNHSITGWGWQQNNTNIIGSEEQNLYNQAQAFYQFINSNTIHYNKTKSTFVYRSGFESAPYWNSTVTILHDTLYSGFWIRNAENKVCMQTNGGPVWNFSNDSAVNYYLQNVIQQVVTNKPYINQVFFDMCDWISCDYNWQQHTNCSNFHPSNDMKTQFGYAAINLFKKVGKILNDNDIIPSISIRTVLSKYINVSAIPCVVPEEEWINALSNITWFRYQEYWPDQIANAETSLNFLNMVEELRLYNNKLPIQVHAYNVAPNAIIDPYYIATLLIAQQDYTYFGCSNGWYDANYSWHDAYNLQYGKPLTMPIQLNDSAWFRKFEYCNITADTKTRIGRIQFAK